MTDDTNLTDEENSRQENALSPLVNPDDPTDQEINEYLSRSSDVFANFGLRGECLQDISWQKNGREALDDHLLKQRLVIRGKILPQEPQQ